MKDFLKRINDLCYVQMKRGEDKQDIGFNSRPFVLCGMPYRRPDGLTWKRRNGNLYLKINGDPEHGLPYGQDRIIPIFLATQAIRQQSREIVWDTAGEVLDMFDLARDGRNYQRLIERFKRIFSSTIFFGNENEEDQLLWARFHFMDKMNLWFNWKDMSTRTLPLKHVDENGEMVDMRNRVVLSESFWNELQNHPIPIDINAVKALTDSPGCLDFYCWLVWRSWTTRHTSRIPLDTEQGLFAQLGMKKKQSVRKKRQTIKNWLKRISFAWHQCDAHFSKDGKILVVPPGRAILS